MSNLVSWSFYTLRRKINPKQWVKSLGIKNYEGFKDELKKRGIKVPPVDMVKDLFEEVVKKVEKVEDDVDDVSTETLTGETSFKSNFQRKNKK